MKWLKPAALCSLIVGTSSCTALGFATDMVVLSAVNGGDNVDTTKEALFFTNEGFKQDVKLVKELVAELSSSSDDLNPLFVKKSQPTTLVCKNVVQGKQQCYAPEYYKNMYIEDSDKKEEAKSATE